MAMNSTIPKLSLPTDADYRNRIDRARAAMKRDGIDVLVAVSADALRFFSGLHGLPVTRPIWLVIPLEGEIGFYFSRQRVQGNQGALQHSCGCEMGGVARRSSPPHVPSGCAGPADPEGCA